MSVSPRASKDAGRMRQLLALVYKGGSRTHAAQLDGVTLQIVRDGVTKI